LRLSEKCNILFGWDSLLAQCVDANVKECDKWHMIKVNKKQKDKYKKNYFKVEQLQIFKCVVSRKITKLKKPK